MKPPRTQSEQLEYNLDYVAVCCATTLESLSLWE